MNKKIKILHTIHSLSGGGAERQLSIVASRSINFDMDVSVFCISDKCDNNAYDQIKIYTSRSQARINLCLFQDLYRVIKQQKPELVHIWLPASISIPAMLVARSLGVPVVFSYRNRMFFSRWLIFLEYMTAWFCVEKIISNNTIEQSTWLYKFLYQCKQGVTIHNAVALPNDIAHQKNQHNNINFVSFGRISKAKNYPVILKALAKIKQYQSWHYDIYGDGEDESDIILLIDNLGLRNRVTIHQYTQEIYSIMSQSDYLIFASLWEGMPNVLIEAIALGLPSIISKIPANQNVLAGLENHFSWFEATSSEALALILKEKISSPKSTLSDAVKQEVVERFSTDHLLMSYQAEYHNILSMNS